MSRFGDWRGEPQIRPQVVAMGNGERPTEAGRDCFKVGPYTVRTRPLSGTTLPRYEIMDGDVVVHTMCSHPSEDDCAGAIREHRYGKPVLVHHNPDFDASKRNAQRRAAAMTRGRNGRR